MSEIMTIKPDRDFINELKSAGGDTLAKCYQCATCSAVCELSPEQRPFPRKEMLYAQWGLKEELMCDPDIWLCYQCNDCSQRCPRDARPGDVMAAIRRQAIKYFAFPRFMGQLLAKPSGLPVLIMVPIIIMLGLIFLNTGGDFDQFMQHEVEYGLFIPHGYVEGLFISGYILILVLAGVGWIRFYKGMSTYHSGKSEGGFISVMVKTIINILLHRRFNNCSAGGYRSTAHMLILFGFMGAGMTAMLALVAMTIAPEIYPPIPITSPIKWLGMASGISILIGLRILNSARRLDDKTAGRITASHNIFLWTILIVSLTGLLLQPFRILDLRVTAYATYFIHLVAVFFLTWYAPYSQFGHMFYRALAMVFAQSINRQPRALSLTAGSNKIGSDI